MAYTEEDFQQLLKKGNVRIHDALKDSRYVPKPAPAEPPRAKGSLKPRRMNGTERKYASHLEMLKHLGEVLWYEFEGITVRIGDDCRFTADFALLTREGFLELHDTKALRKGQTRPHVEDDAAVKMRAASDRYPFRFKAVYLAPDGWKEVDY